jgi:hypothetical protein
MPGDRARNLFLLYSIERVADALAEDEPEALGASTTDLLLCIEQAIADRLS